MKASKTSVPSIKDTTRIYPAKGVKENPRKPGTSGYESFELVKKQPGILYEIFRRAGGRKRDLLWDHQHGRINFQ